jgi:hypothetical protein
MEQLAEAGINFVLEAGPMDLEQEVGATAGPSHLPGFIHAAVDQKFAVPSVSDVPTRGSMARCGR